MALGVVSVALALLAAGSAPAQGLTLPGGATPGGVPAERPLLVPFRVLPGQAITAPAEPSPSGDARQDRFEVRSLLLEGARDRPDLDISLVELAQLVERMRLASVEDEAPRGFTRLLSLARLGQIAGVVTQYYRDRGLMLTQAYVPAQTVEEGRVVIRVVEGILSGVVVEGARRYDTARLLAPFSGLAGRPVTQQSVEKALLAANAYPGVRVFGVFRPGPEPGTSELVLNVDEVPLLTGELFLDNHGTVYTGDIRTRAEVVLNNPWGGGEQLSGTAQFTVSPAKSRYYALQYLRPLADSRTRLGARAARNGFELGGSLGPLDLEGESIEAELFARRQLTRRRTGGTHARLGLTLKHAEMSIPIARQDDLTVAALEWGFERQIGRRGGSDLADVTISQGLDTLGAMDGDSDPRASRVGGSGQGAGSVFTKVNARYQKLRPVTANGNLWLRAATQYSGDLLTSIEQMPVGGPDTVRAYPVSEALVDKGFAVSVDWLARVPFIHRRQAFAGRTWGDLLKVAVFADTAGGWLNDPLVTENPYVRLNGVGVGLRFHLERLSANLEWARPVAGPTASDGDGSRLYFAVGLTL
ncbi:MAG: ShlB/FhaC/HecB family hemolysin secretion/activation protein [Nitrospirae bacterium]|nr:ShlB/FhaC/HecB family hemolysin secretion/activation protein [Nitrospirota bacterium]